MLGISFSSSVEVYIVLRFALAAFIYGTTLGAYVYSKYQRDHVNALTLLNFYSIFSNGNCWKEVENYIWNSIPVILYFRIYDIGWSCL